MSRTDPLRVWELALQAMSQGYSVYLRALKSPQTVASDSLGAAAGAQQPQCTDRYLRIASTAGRALRGAHREPLNAPVRAPVGQNVGVPDLSSLIEIAADRSERLAGCGRRRAATAMY